MSGSRGLKYFLSVVGFLTVFLVMVHFMLSRIGLNANPPRQSVELVDPQVFALVYENDAFYLSEESRSLFDSHEKGTLQDYKPEAFKNLESDIVFLIKSNFDKPEAQAFLKSLEGLDFKKVFVVSPFDSTLKNLRALEPRFYYGLSPQSLTKWALFTSLGLESVFPVSADFVYKDTSANNIFSPAMLKEISRRNIPLIEIQ